MFQFSRSGSPDGQNLHRHETRVEILDPGIPLAWGRHNASGR